MTRGFERPMVGPTSIEEAMPHKTERKKLLITPVRGVWGMNTQTPSLPHFFTQGGPHSPPESPRTPEMLLGSMQGV